MPASAPARDVVWNAGHRKGSAVVELDEATLKRVALVVPRKEVSPRDLPPLAALSSDPPADAVVGKDMRRYHSTSLFCLKVHHPFRRTAIRIVESPPSTNSGPPESPKQTPRSPMPSMARAAISATASARACARAREQVPVRERPMAGRPGL